VKRELFMDYGKLSPDERRAEALARFAEHGRFLDPSTVTCTADEWALNLSLPAVHTTISVDPSATTVAEIVARTADRLGVDAADIRLLDRDGDRLGTAGGVALPCDEGGKRHRLATPGGVALARTGLVGPDDTLHVMLAQEGGMYNPESPCARTPAAQTDSSDAGEEEEESGEEGEEEDSDDEDEEDEESEADEDEESEKRKIANPDDEESEEEGGKGESADDEDPSLETLKAELKVAREDASEKAKEIETLKAELETSRGSAAAAATAALAAGQSQASTALVPSRAQSGVPSSAQGTLALQRVAIKWKALFEEANSKLPEGDRVQAQSDEDPEVRAAAAPNREPLSRALSPSRPRSCDRYDACTSAARACARRPPSGVPSSSRSSPCSTSHPTAARSTGSGRRRAKAARAK